MGPVTWTCFGQCETRRSGQWVGSEWAGSVPEWAGSVPSPRSPVPARIPGRLPFLREWVPADGLSAGQPAQVQAMHDKDPFVKGQGLKGQGLSPSMPSPSMPVHARPCLRTHSSTTENAESTRHRARTLQRRFSGKGGRDRPYTARPYTALHCRTLHCRPYTAPGLVAGSAKSACNRACQARAGFPHERAFAGVPASFRQKRAIRDQATPLSATGIGNSE